MAKAKLDLNKKKPYLILEEDIKEFKLSSFSKEYLQKDILEGTIEVNSQTSYEV